MDRIDSQVLVDSNETEIAAPAVEHRAPMQLVIAASFTADPIEEPLAFWLRSLGVSASIALAPYAQVLQELLNPSSLFCRNKTGFNFLLIRPDDWIRDFPGSREAEGTLRHLEGVAAEFVAAVKAARAVTTAPLCVFLASRAPAQPAWLATALDALEARIVARLQPIHGLHLWTHADLACLYPIAEPADPVSDRIAHIPYTPQYYAALATLIARHITAYVKPRHKVIALDCDNTLWKGICGEDGVHGVELSEAHLQFQNALVRLHDAGVLLSLCSKNNPADVEAVFSARPEMPLRMDHFVSLRVNWQAKSANLCSLAQELDLGLDSFILIDDSPMECAEVRDGCPSVLTLQFPQTAQEIRHFVDHVWAFDRPVLTEEAKRRSAQYKENRERKAALARAASFNDFLASLDLRVDIAPMAEAHLARVSELIQRTNQFNLTGVRRRASELEDLWRSKACDILVAHVRDRFGDYGLVGAVLAWEGSSAIDIDTFVLSCRVLGRGVEQCIVNELGRIARQRGISHVVLRYRPTARNAPALAFLERTLDRHRVPAEQNGSAELVYRVPAAEAEYLQDGLGTDDSVSTQEEHREGKQLAATSPSCNWHETALRLSRVPALIEEMGRARAVQPAIGAATATTPYSDLEVEIAKIFAEVLEAPAPIFGDFFHLGGDSLQAVQVIARVASVLGVELPLSHFLENPKTSEIARHVAGSDRVNAAIPRANRASPLLLSWSQQRLWFIDQLEGGGAAYHSPIAARFRGSLDRAALQAAFDCLLARHESLRTVFLKVDGVATQKATNTTRFLLRLRDLSKLKLREREAELQRQTVEEIGEPFDLSTGPIIRGRLIQLADDDHVLILTLHHIVSDGWSLGLLSKELSALYQNFQRGHGDPLPPLPIHYADYAQWQRQWLSGPILDKLLDYWVKQLQGAPALIELPTDRPRPAVQTYHGAAIPIALPAEITAELKTLSKQTNLTLAMTLLCGWAIMLSRLSGQDDLVIGVPVASRRRTELEGLIGFFVNSLPARIRLEQDLSVRDLMDRVKTTLLDLYANQDAPFEKIVEKLQPARSLSHSPLFQVMFVLQNTPGGTLELPGLCASPHDLPLQTTRFDLFLELQEGPNGLSGVLNYSTDLFDAKTVERWVRCYEVILCALVRQPEIKVSRVPLLGVEQRRQIIDDFNMTHAGYPQSTVIHELFEEQAERTPEAVAVSSGGSHLTYRVLNARANQLARYLRKNGIAPERFVGLCTERGIEMIVGVLAILKAGGAYVPLDLAYPRERLDYIMSDARPHAVITQQHLQDRVPGGAKVIAVDSEWNQISAEDDANLTQTESGVRPNSLAYAIYTSGSTGKPKGVAIEHRNAVNLIYWARDALSRDVFERTLHSTSMNFDLSVYECFVPLSTGGAVRVVPNALALATDSCPVTLINTVPSAIRGVLDAGRIPASTRVVNLAGEPLKKELAERIFLESSVERVCNLYGPSETTTYSTWITMRRNEGFLPTIGHPIANTQVYLLDSNREAVPIGVVGEIYIGGAGVARGYLNRPDLTNERFLSDPFSADPQARMYRTGDLARWRPDGKIEYLGRNDHQLKIRGFRVELGEVEHRLAQHAHVRETVVVAWDDAGGDKRLVAYVVPMRWVVGETETEHTDLVESLHSHLRSRLPDYMIPTSFVLLEHLPLTPNGKVDRRALPAPKDDSLRRGVYEPPREALEEEVAEIWRELLQVERVGRDDSFFSLGGHSILAMKMLARIRATWKVEVPIRWLFEGPMLKQITARLDDLVRVRLLDEMLEAEEEPDRLLEDVAVMPQREVLDLLRRAVTEVRQ